MEDFSTDCERDDENSVISCRSGASAGGVFEDSNNAADEKVKYDELLMDDDDITIDEDEASQKNFENGESTMIDNKLFMTKIPRSMLEGGKWEEDNDTDLVEISERENSAKETEVRSVYLQKCLKCNHEITTSVLQDCAKCLLKMRFICFVCESYSCSTKNTIYSHFKTHHLKQFKDHKIKMNINNNLESSSKASSASGTLASQSTVQIANNTVCLNEDRTPVQRFSCFLCDYSSNSTKSLQEHLKSIHSINNSKECVSCIKCGIKFAKHRYMKKHLKHCGKDPTLLCRFCPYKTKHLYNLQVHLKSHVRTKHTNSSQRILQKASDSSCNDKLAKNVFNSQKKICCLLCTFKTDRSVTLAVHMKNAHPRINTKNYSTCNKCGKILKNWESLRKHFNLCGEEAHLKCDLCLFKTKWHKTLKKHMNSHKKQNSFKSVSNQHQTSADKENENTENISHHSNESGSSTDQQNFNCLLCLFTTTSIKLMHIHKKENHPNYNVQDCTNCIKCGKDFKNINNLRKHYRYCGMEENFKCQFCPFKTKFNARFNLHLSKHKKHMDFYASSLIKAFCKSCNTGRKIVHSRSKCFRCNEPLILSCSYCNAESPTIAELRNHIKQHKGSSNECFKCKRSFANLENFKAHEKVCKN